MPGSGLRRVEGAPGASGQKYEASIKSGAELAQKFAVDRAVLRFGEQAAADAGLIGDQERAETGGLEFPRASPAPG